MDGICQKGLKNCLRSFFCARVMVLAYQLIIPFMHHVTKGIEASLMLIRSPVLLACGESVGVRPYWLVEKIQLSILHPLLRWLVSLHVVCPSSMYPLEKDSYAESIYGRHDEPVRVPVPVRMPPMLVLADSQPYHGDHQEGGASANSCCYYYCLVHPLCVVYAFFSV